jgi:leucyl/phenylalanyl-tRNA--protein transferase
MARYGRIAIVGDDGEFPDPRRGPADLPVAVGLSLTPRLMLNAYAKGIFAWSDEPVAWWSPDPRAVLELDRFHVSRSLARVLRARRFDVTLDRAFGEVVRGCASPRYRGDETWLTRRFAACFAELFRTGRAHSVECWVDGRLAGGVFGVAIGGFFSAESMFHRATDASKVALYHLVEALRAAGYSLLDIQVLTPHTASLGATEIPRYTYLDRLAAAVELAPRPLSTVATGPLVR